MLIHQNNNHMGKQIKTSKTITTVKTQICTINVTHNMLTISGNYKIDWNSDS